MYDEGVKDLMMLIKLLVKFEVKLVGVLLELVASTFEKSILLMLNTFDLQLSFHQLDRQLLK